MHTAIVISAYLAMIFVPCACAQWGDVLTAEWWNLRMAERRAARRRSVVPVLALDPLLEAVRSQQVAIEIDTLAAAAFTDVIPMPRYIAPRRNNGFRRMKQRPPVDQANHQRCLERVAARLAEVAEATKLELSSRHDIAVAAIAATPPPIAAAPPIAAIAPPIAAAAPMREAAYASPQVEHIPIAPILISTPTTEELEALYALDGSASSPSGPAIPIAVVDSAGEAAETPPISIAA